MSRKNPGKPYWEMTTEELREATKGFDEEFVADKSQPLTAEMRAEWERIKAKQPSAEDSLDQQTITVHLEAALLARCTALARI